MKNILCFGDSNTYGLIPNTSERFNFDTRWTGILSKHFLKDGYRVIDDGLCGRTTIFEDPLRVGRNATRILPISLEIHSPLDLVVLMLGTNDCKYHYKASSELIGSGIRQLITMIKNNHANTKILLISPIHLGDDVWNGYDLEFDQKSVDTSRDLKRVYQKIAQEENVYFLAASDFANPSLDDREHLNEAGHKQLAAAVEEKIRYIYSKAE